MHAPSLPGLLVALIAGFLLFGAKRLPEVGASLGQGIREFKKSLHNIGDAAGVASPATPATTDREGGSGRSTTASAQNEAAENKKLVFAVVMKRIFNEGNLALVDDFMAKDISNDGATLGRDGFKAMIRDLRTIVPDLEITVDDLMIQGDRVIARVTQTGGGASERRIILLRIDNGLVQEHWSWADQPGLVQPLGLRADPAPQSTASVN